MKNCSLFPLPTEAFYSLSCSFQRNIFDIRIYDPSNIIRLLLQDSDTSVIMPSNRVDYRIRVATYRADAIQSFRYSHDSNIIDYGFMRKKELWQSYFFVGAVICFTSLRGRNMKRSLHHSTSRIMYCVLIVLKTYNTRKLRARDADPSHNVCTTTQKLYNAFERTDNDYFFFVAMGPIID